MTHDLRPHSASGNGGAEETRGDGHAEPYGRMVDVSPGASGVDADGAAPGVDRGAAQQGKVDDQGVIPHAEPGRVVAATPDGDLEAVFAAETDTGDDVDGVPAARDGGRMLVDHAVVDGARLVVPGVSRPDQVAVQASGQLFVGRRARTG